MLQIPRKNGIISDGERRPAPPARSSDKEVCLITISKNRGKVNRRENLNEIMRIKTLRVKNFRNYAEEEFSFGDGLNDISMFRAAGHSVCLANGSVNARENADEIAPSNDEDGLACWIEANLFH